MAAFEFYKQGTSIHTFNKAWSESLVNPDDAANDGLGQLVLVIWHEVILLFHAFDNIVIRPNLASLGAERAGRMKS